MHTLVVIVALLAFAGALLISQGKITRLAKRGLSWRGFFADEIGGIPFEQISRDAQTALTEFDIRFLQGLTQQPVDAWAVQNGLSVVSDAPRIRFPVAISQTGYKEFTGEIQYRKLATKSLDLIPLTWSDGVEELAEVVAAPDFIDWANEPARMVMAAQSLENELVAAAIIRNGGSWETNAGTINFFQSVNAAAPTFLTGSHPYNIFNTALGGFDNDFTGATLPSHVNLQVAKTRFRKILAPNMRPMGLRLTHIFCPPAQEEQWRNILEQDLIIQSLPLLATGGDGSAANSFGAVNNRHKGTVTLVVCDELGGSYKSQATGQTGSDALWYAAALNLPGKYPWMTHRQATPEVVIFDTSSEFYRTSFKIRYGSRLKAQGVMGLPQLLQRWAGTAS